MSCCLLDASFGEAVAASAGHLKCQAWLLAVVHIVTPYDDPVC